jgi:hypothetical protein
MYLKSSRSLVATLVTGSLTALLQQPVSAAQFHLGWNYALDSANDSLGVNPDSTIQPGGSIYEIFGMAVKDDVATDSVWFAISANLPMYGDNLPQPSLTAEGRTFEVQDSNIGWGDLILDFSGTGNLKSASDTRQLFGIKFSINNDSGVPTLGIYQDVSLASVTTTNAGYSNLGNNNATLESLSAARQGARRSASMGDLDWNDSYFAPYTTARTQTNPQPYMPNVIGSGTKIGEVTLLNRETLVKAGLDPNFFSPSGAEIFGFRLPKELLPVGEFIATLLTECINDGIALSSRLIAPPPPPPQPTPYICPITEGQRNALLPTQVIDGVKIFQNAPSGAWFDPPANMGFQFVSLDGSLFTGISGFPCAVAPETEDIITAPFNVLVKDETGKYEIIGSYDPGATVDFTKIFGRGVSEFIITGIDPKGWEYNPPEGVPLAFALLLNQETANFGFRRINDTTNLPIPGVMLRKPGDPEGSVPGYYFPEISELPPFEGPIPDPACLEGGRCGAVPEPSTVMGMLLATLGALKVRQARRRK